MQSPNDLIHQPVRLKIMAALNTLGSRQWLDFVSLRSIVDTTDGNLGAHLGTLRWGRGSFLSGFPTQDKPSATSERRLC